MQEQSTTATAAAEGDEGFDGPAPFHSFFNEQAQAMLAEIPEGDPGMALALATGAQAVAILDVAQALRELTSVAGQVATFAFRSRAQPEGMIAVVR